MTMMFFSVAGGVLGVPVALQIVPASNASPLLVDGLPLDAPLPEVLLEVLPLDVFPPDEMAEVALDDSVALPLDGLPEMLLELEALPAGVLLLPLGLDPLGDPPPPQATSGLAMSEAVTATDRSFMRLLL